MEHTEGQEREAGHRDARKFTEERSFYSDLNVKDKTLKLLHENKGVYLHDLGLAKIF